MSTKEERVYVSKKKLDDMLCWMEEHRFQVLILIHDLEATRRERDKAFNVLGWKLGR